MHLQFQVELREARMNYIATQGPLVSTISSFWTMVYQHNSNIVLMLANEIEGGKSKCAKYWPDVGRFDKNIF